MKAAQSFVVGLAMVFAGGCTPSGPEKQTTLNFGQHIHGIKSISAKEGLEDFHELVRTVRNFYGPLQFKEKRFQFSFDEKVLEFEQRVIASQNDSELFSVFAEFISLFQDGHVGITFALNDSGFNTYDIPLVITPVEGRVLISKVGDELKGTSMAEPGDEVILVDGLLPMSYLPSILKYQVLATAESNEHYIHFLFNRPFFMKDLLPTKPTTTVRFQKRSGAQWTEELIWRPKKVVNEVSDFVSPLNEVSRILYAKNLDPLREGSKNSVADWGSSSPFFATPNVAAFTNWIRVEASENYRKKYGLTHEERPDIFAAIYDYGGKKILLVRNYTYSHGDFSNEVYMKGYRAVLDQWQSVADVLVLDQTHNGGGSYCEDFARLFLQRQGAGFVQALNADRKWIWELNNGWMGHVMKNNGSSATSEAFLVSQLISQVVEKVYDEGRERLTPPLPIIGGKKRILPDDQFVWTKPMLVLIDELAGSCGDVFPMLMQANQVAPLFGAKTMGLGGSVEIFGLSNSRSQLRLTRGLFTFHRESEIYTAEDWIENNAVIPDIPYRHTVKDFRNGFVNYVDTFSREAVKLAK